MKETVNYIDQQGNNSQHVLRLSINKATIVVETVTTKTIQIRYSQFGQMRPNTLQYI